MELDKAYVILNGAICPSCRQKVFIKWESSGNWSMPEHNTNSLGCLKFGEAIVQAFAAASDGRINEQDLTARFQ